MPDEMTYDAGKRRLNVGTGYIDNVPPEVWNYEVSGKRVLTQWFSYRRRNRERPIIGDRRKPSALGDIQPDHWLAEYTAELLNVLHVLRGLIHLEAEQAELLDRVCSSKLIAATEFADAKVLDVPPTWRKALSKDVGLPLFTAGDRGEDPDARTPADGEA